MDSACQSCQSAGRGLQVGEAFDGMFHFTLPLPLHALQVREFSDGMFHFTLPLPFSVLQVGEFFDGLPPGELRYVPNGFMRERYPDDFP